MSTSTYSEVSALIPTALVPQFYRWVVDAHDASTTGRSGSAAPSEVPTEIPSERTAFLDVESADIRTWWLKLSDTAREVLTFLAHNADEHFDGSELAAECDNISGPSGTAGIFTWPSRHAQGLGFEVPWGWDGLTYFMTRSNASALLAAVTAEPSQR